jgi:uncharacterized protein (DUF488 family)
MCFMAAPIYTIGYGNRSIENFIQLLATYHIQYLVDIRSFPYSRPHADFSKAALMLHLKKASVQYVFMGDALGGRPVDQSCYVDGKVDYTKVKDSSNYQKGIQRLQTAFQKQLTVALMCSELRPQECHRSKLVGNTLQGMGIDVDHIDEMGNCKTQQEIELLLTGGQLSLFEHPATDFSRKV